MVSPVDAASPSRVPALPQASLLPGDPQCQGSVPASGRARGARCSGGAGQRCREQGEQPGSPAPRCAQLLVSLALPSPAKAGTVSFPPRGWHRSCARLPAASLPPASPCWTAASVFEEPVSVSVNPLAPGAQLRIRWPGPGAAALWPRWSLTNSLCLRSEYLQCLCWSIPKQILYITGINQVKHQPFSAAAPSEKGMQSASHQRAGRGGPEPGLPAGEWLWLGEEGPGLCAPASACPAQHTRALGDAQDWAGGSSTGLAPAGRRSHGGSSAWHSPPWVCFAVLEIEESGIRWLADIFGADRSVVPWSCQVFGVCVVLPSRTEPLAAAAPGSSAGRVLLGCATLQAVPCPALPCSAVQAGRRAGPRLAACCPCHHPQPGLCRGTGLFGSLVPEHLRHQLGHQQELLPGKAGQALERAA